MSRLGVVDAIAKPAEVYGLTTFGTDLEVIDLLVRSVRRHGNQRVQIGFKVGVHVGQTPAGLLSFPKRFNWLGQTFHDGAIRFKRFSNLNRLAPGTDSSRLDSNQNGNCNQSRRRTRRREGRRRERA